MRTQAILLSVTIAALAGCGGGGGGHSSTAPTNSSSTTDTSSTSSNSTTINSTTPVTLSSTNSGDVGFMGAAAAKDAVQAQSSPSTPSIMRSDIHTVRLAPRKLATTVPNICASGSLTVDTNSWSYNNCAMANICSSGSVVVNGTGTVNPEAWNLAFTWNNCNEGGEVINGTSNSVASNNGDSESTTSNISWVFNGQTENYNGTETCTGLLSDNPTCTTSDNFTAGSRSYSTSSTSVSGNGSSGYTVTTRVSSSDGYVDVETTQPLLFNCSNGWPSAGVIKVTAAGNTVETVTFTSCDSFTVTFNGVAKTYSWSQF